MIYSPGEIAMTQLRQIVTAGILTVSLATVSFGGTITGSRTGASSARVGTITGSRTGTITGSRTGTITGSRVGTITGSRFETGSSNLQDELLSRLIAFLVDVSW
jgi:hypothetical protein